MNDTAILTTTRDLPEALQTLDFRRKQQNTFARNGVLARPTWRWLSFESSARGETNPLQNGRRRLGLWKLVVPKPNVSLRWEFHLPRAVIDVPTSVEDEENPLEVGIEWVLSTAAGELPAGWETPPRSEVEGWIPDGGLSVQTGPFARQGSLIHEPARLGLTFPLLHEIPQELSEARRSWLRAVLLDAQSRWNMVRIVVHDSDRQQPSVEARIDLSGAPPLIVEALFKLSLDALRWVVQWLVWPVGFVADPNVKCDVWEVRLATFFRKE